MENIKYLSFAIVIALLMNACSDDSNSTGPEPPPPGEEASSEKQFVYNAMNEWYLWQEDVSDLADNRFEDDQAKQAFLIGFSDASDLYEDLQIESDQFSFFIDDYEEYEDRQDGIQAALGLMYGYIDYGNGDDRIGYVQYVVPDSPSDNAGLQRYDLFTKVDGVDLEGNNIIQLLTTTESHTLTMAEIDTSNNNLSFPETGEEVMVSSERVVEDPVDTSAVIDTSNVKIGYLKYNAFQGNSHSRLNEVFGTFKAENIDELVLDLRYNGGGAVITSQLLGSMISGLGSSDTFGNFVYNGKKSQLNYAETFLDEVPLQDENGDYTESEPINKLSVGRLNRIYVITSRGTASASELVMNSLMPFIDVVQIGQKTIGKDVGSITLYDAAPNYSNKTNINPDHKKAIQPIVVSFTNSNGENYPDGFTPTNQQFQTNGLTAEALFEKKPLGDPEEPLFELAISDIIGASKAKILREINTGLMRNAKEVWSIQDERPRSRDMYIEPFMMPKKK